MRSLRRYPAPTLLLSVSHSSHVTVRGDGNEQVVELAGGGGGGGGGDGDAEEGRAIMMVAVVVMRRRTWP